MTSITELWATIITWVNSDHLHLSDWSWTMGTFTSSQDPGYLTKPCWVVAVASPTSELEGQMDVSTSYQQVLPQCQWWLPMSVVETKRTTPSTAYLPKTYWSFSWCEGVVGLQVQLTLTPGIWEWNSDQCLVHSGGSNCCFAIPATGR